MGSVEKALRRIGFDPRHMQPKPSHERLSDWLKQARCNPNQNPWEGNRNLVAKAIKQTEVTGIEEIFEGMGILSDGTIIGNSENETLYGVSFRNGEAAEILVNKKASPQIIEDIAQSVRPTPRLR